MTTYKTIPGPMNIAIDSKGSPSAALAKFADIMNAEAKQGWTYHSMEVITITKKVGCLMFKSFEQTNYYMLIFAKEI